jgi:hypothetical protein
VKARAPALASSSGSATSNTDSSAFGAAGFSQAGSQLPPGSADAPPGFSFGVPAAAMMGGTGTTSFFGTGSNANNNNNSAPSFSFGGGPTTNSSTSPSFGSTAGGGGAGSFAFGNSNSNNTFGAGGFVFSSSNSATQPFGGASSGSNSGMQRFSAAEPGVRFCRYLMSAGGCARGSACRYSHDRVAYLATQNSMREPTYIGWNVPIPARASSTTAAMSASTDAQPPSSATTTTWTSDLEAPASLQMRPALVCRSSHPLAPTLADPRSCVMMCGVSLMLRTDGVVTFAALARSARFGCAVLVSK